MFKVRRFHSGPPRLQLPVANDVGMKLAVKGFSCSSAPLHQTARWVKEYLSNYATVDVHLLKMLAIDVNVNHDRRDRAGNARRSNHDLSKQLERTWRIAGRDSTHIPRHRAPGIKVGRSDLQDAPRSVFSCDRRQDLRRDVLCDESLQRPTVRHAIAREAREPVARMKDVLRSGRSEETTSE